MRVESNYSIEEVCILTDDGRSPVPLTYRGRYVGCATRGDLAWEWLRWDEAHAAEETIA